ncbi:DUF11 domain-containing protein [Saccharomonospora sp. NPDC046836]|uniref:DUF11 domain-containing protein n=1 Tax=Saccharomonospora sp. NPDC046836 TaxID=3156921 RepID=UPI0033C30324
MVATALRRVGMATLAAAATAGSMVLLGPGTAAAATPFTCTGQVFLAQGVPAQLYSGSFGEGSIGFAPVGAPAPDHYNAIGYNSADNYIYGLRGTNAGLWQIDATGAVVGFGPPTNLPAPGNVPGTTGGYNVGAFDDQGLFWVTSSNATAMFAIDVSTNTMVRRVNLTAPFDGADWTFADGYFWSANSNGAVVRVNPNTGGVERFAGVVPVGGFGGAFTYGNGDLGFYDNAGLLHRVEVANPSSASPTFTLISTQAGPSSGANDATSCVAQPTDLGIVKVGSPDPVQVGGTVTYTLTVTNHGPGGSSGYSVSDVLPAGLSNVQSGTPGCTVAGNDLSCTGGALAVGESAQITVTATAGGPVGEVMNSATVRGNEEDPNPDNNTADETVEIVDVPLLAAGIALGGFGAVGAGFGLRRHRARRKVVG